MGNKGLQEGSRAQREKEKGGTGWNEGVRRENAVPMLHQKLMQTKLVQRSRREGKNKTKHANSLESPASALPPCFLSPQPLHCTNTRPF